MATLDLTEPALLDELVEIIAEMLDGVVEASIPDGLVHPVAAYEHQTAEATIEIRGSETRILHLRVQASLAIGLAAAMMGEDPAELVAEDACAVISEMANVLGGSVKTLFDEVTSLGIPTSCVKDTGEFDVLEGSVFVDHQLGVFQVRLGR